MNLDWTSELGSGWHVDAYDLVLQKIERLRAHAITYMRFLNECASKREWKWVKDGQMLILEEEYK